MSQVLLSWTPLTEFEFPKQLYVYKRTSMKIIIFWISGPKYNCITITTKFVVNATYIHYALH